VYQLVCDHPQHEKDAHEQTSPQTTEGAWLKVPDATTDLLGLLYLLDPKNASFTLLMLIR